MLIFHWQELQALATEIFARLGAPPEEAACVAALLVRSDLCGHPSHGVLRIPQYYRGCRDGQIRPAARPVVESTGPGTLLLDGAYGFGQVVGRRAMELAIDGARRHGLAAVAVRRCNHLGRLADYAEQAAEAGMVGFVLANDSGALQRVAPHGAVEGRFSTNPVAVGIPRSSSPHLVVDMATSVVASGKLQAALAAGEPIPEGWVQDADGNPTTDPAAPFGATPRGTLLPMAGYKGYALALVVEVLAGVLTGSGFSRPDPGPDYQGVFLWAIDVGRFVPLERFVADVEQLVAYVKTARLRPGVRELVVPGEAAWRTAAQRRADGIPVAETTWAEIAGICRALAIAPPAPRGTA